MLKSLARRGRVVLIQLREGITFTWNELKNNKFRTFLSLLGVSIGIFTIVAIFTAIDALRSNVKKGFESLASNQVQVSKWPMMPEDENGNPTKVVDHRLINPRIISESVKESYLGAGEGCLSVKENHEGYVYRKFKIIVKAFDAVTRKEKIITARGYEAIVLQHELDHLNGVLYYDHINKENPFIRKEDAIRI